MFDPQDSYIINLREKESTKKSQTESLSSILWETPEFTKYEKDSSWTFWLFIFILIPAIYAVFTKNFLLVIILVLSGFLLYSYGHRNPRSMKFSVSPRGIMIGGRLYSFDNLKSFWIFYRPPEIKEISFRSKKTLMPYIKIPLGNQDPVRIRKILVKYLPERKQNESMVEELSRKLGF